MIRYRDSCLNNGVTICCANSTTHHSHIPRCIMLQQKCAHLCTFLLQNDALWDICLKHYGIWEMGNLMKGNSFHMISSAHMHLQCLMKAYHANFIILMTFSSHFDNLPCSLWQKFHPNGLKFSTHIAKVNYLCNSFDWTHTSQDPAGKCCGDLPEDSMGLVQDVRSYPIWSGPWQDMTSQPYGDTTKQPLPDCQESTWWRHQMETFFASLALCEGNQSGFPL